MVDCEDPECCANHLCRSSQLCVSSPKPIDILLRKQPPAITASFFERMKFLIDEGSLQNYARQETFNERYVTQCLFYFGEVLYINKLLYTLSLCLSLLSSHESQCCQGYVLFNVSLSFLLVGSFNIIYTYIIILYYIVHCCALCSFTVPLVFCVT